MALPSTAVPTTAFPTTAFPTHGRRAGRWHAGKGRRRQRPLQRHQRGVLEQALLLSQHVTVSLHMMEIQGRAVELGIQHSSMSPLACA